MKVFKPLFAIALMTAIAGVISPVSLAPLEVSIGIEAAEARRSGGRSGGGSFSRPRSSGSSGSRSNSSPSRSQNTSPSSGSNTRTAPSNNTPSSNTPSSGVNRGNTGGATRGGSFSRPSPSPGATVSPTESDSIRRDDFDRGGGGTVVVPVPVPVYSNPVGSPARVPASEYAEPSGGSSDGSTTTEADRPVNSASSSTSDDDDGSFFGFLIFLLVVGGFLYLAWRLLRSSKATGASELDNDIVTVSKLQIGLLASAKTLQAQLTQLSEDADLSTMEGLAAFSQDCALALLRNPDYWVYAASESETVENRETAQQRFESISIGERMKFDAETFSRKGDRVTVDEDFTADPDEEPAEYIVVTLVAGTEGDRPLFPPVHTADDVEAALKTIGSLTGDYLSVFEVLWTPQTAEDSLTSEELLELYPDITPVG